MFYVHADDIDQNQEFDVPTLDDLLSNVVNRCSRDLRDRRELKEIARNMVADLLSAFLFTHKSIRLLYGQYEAEMALGADAMSLAREQVEKIFTLSLILDDPDKWVDVYLKDNWRKTFESYLLCKAECKDLPRYNECLITDGPRDLEKSRKFFGISDEEMVATENKFLGKTQPPSLKDKIIREFPTPGVAKDKVKDIQLKQSLQRWYLEYRNLCGFSHGGMSKLVAQGMANPRFRVREEDQTTYRQNVLEYAPILSYIATTFACTEVYRYVSDNPAVAGELTRLWNEIERISLLGKAFWNMRAKNLLPLI